MNTKNEIKIAKLRVMLFDVLEHMACSNISYANGNVAEGTDEGEYYGQRAHMELVKKIGKVLNETEPKI